ncbi:hypothetical protein HPB50_015011 [Hyalomma asiaticum]|uniref:Uncharacterized protein n=1 Tax=Hyalomma asiaticum TaxID=266040 RepID=A0ACB7T9U8_HYAAI|nr:hypothetical protein HPB50_015011 [Hyalomma asiaticum]
MARLRLLNEENVRPDCVPSKAHCKVLRREPTSAQVTDPAQTPQCSETVSGSLHHPFPALAWPPCSSLSQWYVTLNNYLLASGAPDFKPKRIKALLLHSLGVEDRRAFFTLPLTSDATQIGESAASCNRV